MRRRGPIVAALVSVGVALLVLVALVLPKVSEVGSQQDKLDQARRQETVLRAQLAQLKEARRQAARVQAALKRLETEVPPTADLPSLIRLLDTAAARSAVDFMSVSPGTPTQSATGPISVVPAQITATGSFFAVDEFLFRLETLPRALKVTTITVGPAAEQVGGTLQLAIGAEVYTTDASAGPGSEPGPTAPTEAVATPPPATPVPSPSPTSPATTSPGG